MGEWSSGFAEAGIHLVGAQAQEVGDLLGDHVVDQGGDLRESPPRVSTGRRYTTTRGGSSPREGKKRPSGTSPCSQGAGSLERHVLDGELHAVQLRGSSAARGARRRPGRGRRNGRPCCATRAGRRAAAGRGARGRARSRRFSRLNLRPPARPGPTGGIPGGLGTCRAYGAKAGRVPAQVRRAAVSGHGTAAYLWPPWVDFAVVPRPRASRPRWPPSPTSAPDSTAVLGPLATYAEPHCYDLCAQHAERLTAPRGWEIVRLAGQLEAPAPSHDDLLALADAVREAARPRPEAVAMQAPVRAPEGRRPPWRSAAGGICGCCATRSRPRPGRPPESSRKGPTRPWRPDRREPPACSSPAPMSAEAAGTPAPRSTAPPPPPADPRLRRDPLRRVRAARPARRRRHRGRQARGPRLAEGLIDAVSVPATISRASTAPRSAPSGAAVPARSPRCRWDR